MKKKDEMDLYHLGLLANSGWSDEDDCRLDGVFIFNGKRYCLFYNVDKKECAVFEDGEMLALASRCCISPVILDDQHQLTWKDYQWFLAKVTPISDDTTSTSFQKE